MKTLFDPVVIGAVSLKNRIIRSATLESPADARGRFAAALLPLYAALAEGGVGAIITGMMGVGPNARLRPSMADAGTDEAIAELRALADCVHARGSRLVVQLSHCGRKSTVLEGYAPLGPMDAPLPHGPIARAMTPNDIEAVALNFAAAASRCKEAGADAVQMHAAHGYLLSQFLSPFYNKRQDGYGGGITGRARIVLEVYDAIRSAVGADFPIWIKINATDLVDETITWDECLWVCAALAERGINAIELSGGIAESARSSSAPPVRDESEEGVYGPEALALAESVSTPVISVCGYRTPAVINEWLNRGRIAAISLCRPLISEPGLVARWQSGDTAKARCISCNKCFRPKDGRFGCRAFAD